MLKLTVLPQVWTDRPKTRGDCVGMPRPCPWLFCRHHLAVETLEQRRNLQAKGRKRLPDDVDAFVEEAMEMEESCSLDAAECGPAQHDEIGALFDVTHEAVRLTEVRALHGALKACLEQGIEPHAFYDHLVTRGRKGKAPRDA